ncbi:hypothetical protein IU438_09025 [Nocardia cyriacigeorgica]|uniref:hypothetical protein n=1 Tax=Nocardia cyriacigeorgica TaxID=135487 RepID=UPI0018939FDE|nr:hypothetical protein [Nocardia cyriacigeorgica]MBF6395933.1 hypothetical protein [Nocardia cyriacigeorgica]
MASGATTPRGAATHSSSAAGPGDSAGRSAAPGRWSADGSLRSAGGTRIVRRLLSGLLPLGLLVGLFFAAAPDGEMAAAPRHRQPEGCAAISSGSACALGPLLRGLVRTAPLPRTPSGSR